MNTIKPNTPDEIIALMQAFKDGKKIVIHSICPILGGAPGWRSIESGKWDFTNYRYEVRPEPMEIWAALNSDGSIMAAHKDRSKVCNYGVRTVLLREVIE